MVILGVGAEAVVSKGSYLGTPAVKKKRVAKQYRNSLLDEKIRSKRLKQECMLLMHAKQALVRCPAIIKIDPKNCEITMEFVRGEKMRDFLDKKNYKKLCNKIGFEIGKLHFAGIAHGDLTTSNIIVSNGAVAFVDFGLGFFSKKTEDFATDLLSFKKTFLATHYYLKGGFEQVLLGYKKSGPKPSETISQIAAIEARTRYS